MQNVKVLFHCNGEAVRYIRDLLWMIWEDLPARMIGDDLHIEFPGRGGQRVWVCVMIEPGPVGEALPAPRRGLVLRIGDKDYRFGSDVSHLFKAVVALIRREYLSHVHDNIIDFLHVV
jgi:hypothetical protein